ncbi:MAG TPA: plastocyanin/azurin family copper-binding protein [Actinomycetota bacterium]|nr:plastocyanin/azurin family copper-binding protein [Actinomycetota bacterium]
MRRGVRSISVAALVVLLVGAPAAQAAPAVTGPAAFVSGYATPVVVIAEGEDITYYNFDIAPHDFVAREDFLSKKAARKAKWCSAFDGKCPMFWSQRVGVGQSTEVLGLEAVKSGEQYAFYCTVHPNMTGTLIVR